MYYQVGTVPRIVLLHLPVRVYFFFFYLALRYQGDLPTTALSQRPRCWKDPQRGKLVVKYRPL